MFFLSSNLTAASRARELRLGTSEVRSLLDISDLEIVVGEGRVWITQPGDAQDYVLGPGDSFRPKGGRIVLQALGGPATLEARPAGLRRMSRC
jgi:hypothetical protein